MRAQRRRSSSLKLSPTGAVTKAIIELCMAAVQIQDNYCLVKKTGWEETPQPVFVTSGFIW
jgi:GH43 family beta-xylosidase